MKQFCVYNAEVRLKGATIRLGDDPNRNNPICGTVTDDQIEAGQEITLFCDSLRGQYLSIQLPQGEPLTLCEVKVYEGQCDGR